MDKTLGLYRILREIGKGGMGIIYKALDPKTQENVAIKVLPTTMVDRTTVERFNREAQAMKNLKHSNMINVHDFGMEKGEHYIVMEFVEGENLKTIIKQRGSLTETDSLNIASQALQALAYTHGEGIIHRDIKPGNIMITTKGKVKVMDFGLAKILGVSNLTIEGSSIGTPEYMSPEQAAGEEVDSRTDIYSLGITLYEMLTGKVPFSGDNLQALLMKQKFDAAPSVRDSHPEISLETEKVVEKAIQKELSMRYQKADEFLDEISRVIGNEPSKPEPEDSSGVTQVIGPETISDQDSKATQQAPQTTVTPQPSSSESVAVRRFPIGLVGFVIIAVLGYFGYTKREQIKMWYSDVTSNIDFSLEKDEEDLLSETNKGLERLELAEVYHQKGLKYYKLDLTDKSIAEFKKAIKLRPDYPKYYKDLAFAYEKKEDANNAIKAWKNLLKYEPKGTLAEIARDHIMLLE